MPVMKEIAEKSYLYAEMSTTQTTGISVGSPVLFDTDTIRIGENIGAVSSNSWVLKAGRTYDLHAQVTVTFSGTTLHVIVVRWYDITGAAYIGSTGVRRAIGDPQALAEGQDARASFAPSVDSTVELRITYTEGTVASISKDHTWLTIETKD